MWNDIWSDPVWSKVISAVLTAAILGIFGWIGATFRKQIRAWWGRMPRQRKLNEKMGKYLEDPLFIQLFLKSGSREVVIRQVEHRPEYQFLINNLKKDGLISVDDKTGIPELTRKGKNWLARS